MGETWVALERIRARMLALTIAHEIGHLLLLHNCHSPTVMGGGVEA